MERQSFFEAWRDRIGLIAHSFLRRAGLRPLRFHDSRGGRVVFVPHCALNQNARVAGAAERTAAVDELIQGLVARGIGIVQMPCPELLILGLDRAHLSIRDAVQTAKSQTQLRRLASEVADQIEQYRSCGVNVLGILGKNGSPTCGVEQTWEEGIVPGTGLFIERLRQELDARRLPVNLAGYCDSSPEHALRTVDRWLKETRKKTITLLGPYDTIRRSSPIFREEQLMKIAVASQNRHTITEHAGRCRKFWIYETSEDAVMRKELLELPKEQSFHESSPHAPHPLDDVQVLIAGNMGTGLLGRLEAKGIRAIVTPETDPDRAVAAYLDGSLVIGTSCAHDHDEESEDQHACHCGE